MSTLAATYAEVGNYEDAVKWQKKALESSEALSKADLELCRLQLKLYEQGKPYCTE